MAAQGTSRTRGSGAKILLRSREKTRAANFPLAHQSGPMVNTSDGSTTVMVSVKVEAEPETA
jgi:hypothetical protein